MAVRPFCNCTEKSNIKVTVVDLNTESIPAWNDTNLDNLPIFNTGFNEVVAEAR